MAVQKLRIGKDVITWYRKDARSAAAIAGGAEPTEHDKHKNLPGYYRHYHLGKHVNGAHSFFIE